MQRVTAESLMAAALVTLASIVAFLLLQSWTPVPEQFAGSYLGGAENAKRIVNETWPFHLVPPTWLSQTDDLLLRWAAAEERAREVTIILLWLAIVLIVILRDAMLRRRKA